MDTLKKMQEAAKAAAEAVFASATQAAKGRATYLRALIEGVQETLDGKKGLDQPAQTAALNEVNKTFYEAVLDTARKFVPKGTKGRAAELHRMATFARTSASALRMHIRAGGDICALKASDVTKKNLKSPARPARRGSVSTKRLTVSAGRQVASFLETIDKLGAADKAEAITELQTAMGLLASKLLALEGRKLPGQQLAEAEGGPRVVPRHLEVTRHRVAA